MKERGKAVEAFSNDFSEFNFSAASEIPCKKHPSSSSVGICAYCLKQACETGLLRVWGAASFFLLLL
ncbi:UNVERIFIED_CONTAM: hypothetical protein Sradi_1016900 [Sesamum radiatum]|uniref:Uncharacterized protein n=1 Tax=Sesamum radiatum TaxID=300843 RepID=A0AAW2V5Z7_SESRA